MRATNRGEDIYIHDILMDLFFLGDEGSCDEFIECGHKNRKGDVWRNSRGIPRYALSSQKIR